MAGKVGAGLIINLRTILAWVRISPRPNTFTKFD